MDGVQSFDTERTSPSYHGSTSPSPPTPSFPQTMNRPPPEAATPLRPRSERFAYPLSKVPDREATCNGPYHLIAPSYLTQIILVSHLRLSTEGIRQQQLTQFRDIALEVSDLHSSVQMIEFLRDILSSSGAGTALQCLNWLDRDNISLRQIMVNVPNCVLATLFGELVRRIIFTTSIPEAHTALDLFSRILYQCEPTLWSVLFKSCAALLPPEMHIRCLEIFTLPDFIWGEKQNWNCEFVICLGNLYTERKSVNRG